MQISQQHLWFSKSKFIEGYNNRAENNGIES